MATATATLFFGSFAEADTLVVEDGTGKDNAESYGSVAEADAFLECGPYADVWAALTYGEKACLLKMATRFFDLRFRFYGQVVGCDQKLQWPRTKNYDSKGCVIPAGTIPDQLKEALFELAGAFAADPDALEAVVEGTGAVKSWSTDGLSIGFDVGANDGEGEGFKGAGSLLGDRYINVEFNLRSIATLNDVRWLQKNKQTVVRR